MASQLLLLCLGLCAVANQQVIDPFEFSNSETARLVWTSSSGTPPVEVLVVGDRRVLQVQAPFAARDGMRRAVIDRRLALDLAAPGHFTLEIMVAPPEAVGEVTLYFHSGSGWYAAGGRLRPTYGRCPSGWQTLSFSKASFRTEDTPDGWDKIDGMRIALWREKSLDCTIHLARLAAQWHDVALVVPAVSKDSGRSEIATAHATADRMAGMLAELGIGSDYVEDTSVAQGGLGNRRLAVLAYHPYLDDEAAASLERFVAGGGKLFACYTIPPRLAKLLGLGHRKHVKQTHDGQFAEIRFDAPDVAGLPASVRQASWNINVAEPDGRDARVIGRWFDSAGKPTGHPAVVLSDSGAFITHIVLDDDREAKKRMLAAILGRLEPSLWAAMVRAERERIGRVGHCDGFDQVAAFVTASENLAAKQRLRAAEQARRQADAELARQAYPEAVHEARRAHDLVADAYLRAVPSPGPEGRGFWNHSGTGAYPGDWERSARELSAAGFNMIVPNMLWGGRAHYASDVLPRSSTFDEYGDQIAQCVAACKKCGIEVHVWKVNWNLSGAPKDFVARLRSEGRTQVAAAGEPYDWLCPSHPENFNLELESMLEVARSYEVDGLHFDYIRYPNSTCCYCEGCRSRFEADEGLSVTDWPRQCRSGDLAERYNDWRCRQITRLVVAVSREAKKIKPDLKISAAVFGSYPDCRRSVAQDWPAWVAAGYLDFVCPMDYTDDDQFFSRLVANQLELVGGRIPIYPGIGATASRATLSGDRVVGQIQLARQLGAAGFTIFNFHPGTAAEIVPAVALGAGSQQASPPHRRP